MQGENFLNLRNAEFPEKITWEQLSHDSYVAGEYPIATYWYVKPDDAHAIVHLSAGASSLVIELSRKKGLYHFPADYSNHEDGANALVLYANDNSGKTVELAPGRNAMLTVQVEQLDALNLRLILSGTLASTHGNVGIDGKISLHKENGALSHLQDVYSGCDNTIYDKKSPSSDLGQWRSPAACEVSFYQLLFTGIRSLFAPVKASLKAKGWSTSAAEYEPLSRINRSSDQNNDYFRLPRKFAETFTADPMKGEFHDYLQKVLDMSKSASLSDPAQMERIQAFSKQGQGRYTLNVEVAVNKKAESIFALDFSRASIKKVSESVYIISGVAGDYNGGAGTYIFVGNWGGEPRWNDHNFSMNPQFPIDAPKLTVQAFYVYLGCNDEFAQQVLTQIDMVKLTQLLELKP